MKHSPVLATADTIQTLHDEAFWRDMFPELSLDGSLLSKDNIHLHRPEPRQMQRLHNQMHDEGYFRDASAWLGPIVTRLAEATKHCVAEGIPQQFLFLFDEPWACFFSLHEVLSDMLGGEYKILPDFWLWHVDPKKRESGWGPHRDKGPMALDKDGSPLSLTVWMPLSEASPMNGCMYILPACWDPYYNTPDTKSQPTDLASYRALPAVPGEYFCWNQAVLHYGARSSAYAHHPRMSMALEFQRANIAPFNTPLLEPLVSLPFAQRFRLVCKQILQYKHMYPLGPELEAFCHRVVTG